MGVCPNCGSWVDDGDICMNCGGSGSYSVEIEDDEPMDYPIERREESLGKKAWKYYMDYDDEEALYYINEALDLNDRHSNNWNRKAIILESLKRFDESERCYDRSLKLKMSNVVSDNKARMLYDWASMLIEESKKLADGRFKLKMAQDKLTDAINALSGEESEEDIEKYLRLRDSINFLMDYESRFQANLETLKRHGKSRLFTITGMNHYVNVVLTPGMALRIVREPDNDFDQDAIAVFAGDEKVGYVANNDYNSYELTSKASELKDEIHGTVKAEYLFYLDRYVDIQYSIGRLIG